MKIPHRTTMAATEHFRHRLLVPLTLTLWLAPACGDEPCDLRVSQPSLSLQDARGNQLPQASIAVTWKGVEGHVVTFRFTCGLPAEPTSGNAETCAFTIDYVREPGRYGAGTLALRIDAPGLVPLDKEYSRTVDGCDVAPKIAEVLTLADDTDVGAICGAMCTVEIQCDPDAGWTVEECTSVCEEDLAISGDEADACRPAFAAMYACIGELSCPEYAAFVADESNPCLVAEQHVATCEAQGPSPAVEPSP